MLRWYILKAIHRPPSSDLILKWMNIFRITVATEEQQPWTDWKGPVVDKALCTKLCKVGGPLPTGGNIGKRLRHEASPFKQVFVIIFIINQLWTSKYQKDNTLYLNGRCEKIVTQSSCQLAVVRRSVYLHFCSSTPIQNSCNIGRVVAHLDAVCYSEW